MKKKQILVACLPAVITLLIIVMNVLAESKVSALYRNAVAALNAQDYSAAERTLSQIQTIAPEYVPQYALHAECYLRMSKANQQVAYQTLIGGIRATGSKYLISLADRLAHGDTSLVQTQAVAGQAQPNRGQSDLPQTNPEDSDFLQLVEPQQSDEELQYAFMNYDFIVRYPNSQMENDIQLSVTDGSSVNSWTWTSSNPTIASVNEQGVVHCGNQEGEAKITAKNHENIVAECWVCVIEPGIYSNDDAVLGGGAASYWYTNSDYYYIPEGNLSLDVGDSGMDAAVASTKTKSVLEFLPRNSVSGDGLIGTAELSYTPSSSAFMAEMVDENGFPIYQMEGEADRATAESAQQDMPDGGAISLQLGWQSLYFSGEYRIPDHLRFNGAEFTPTSVDFNNVYDSDITSLYLPASVTDIHMGDAYNPFSNYDKLESITVAEGNPAFKTEDGALLTADGAELIAFPRAASETEYSIPDGVTTIAAYAFANNENLTALHIPATVTEIGPDALSNIPTLQSISLDSGNTAFQVVDGVLMNAAGTEILAATTADMPENYTIPAQVTSVNEDIFRQNSKVKNLTVDASLGSLSLDDCTGLETLVINGSVDVLSYHSTSDSKLKKVTINGEMQSFTCSGENEGLEITLNAPVGNLYAADFPVKLVNPENVTTSLSLYLNGDTGAALSPTLQSLTLNLGEQEISNLQIVRPCASLSSLILRQGTVKDLSALASLPLQDLELFSVNTQDFSPIWQCTQLTSLSITGNETLTSIEGIQALQNLSTVDLSNSSNLTDVSPLASCGNLISVNLSYCNRISDISSLLELPSLQRIFAYGITVPDETVQDMESRGISVY